MAEVNVPKVNDGMIVFQVCVFVAFFGSSIYVATGNGASERAGLSNVLALWGIAILTGSTFKDLLEKTKGKLENGVVERAKNGIVPDDWTDDIPVVESPLHAEESQLIQDDIESGQSAMPRKGNPGERSKGFVTYVNYRNLQNCVVSLGTLFQEGNKVDVRIVESQVRNLCDSFSKLMDPEGFMDRSARRGRT